MIVVFLGTRPEIIKMSPVLRELRKKRVSFQLVHSGQHYSKELDKVFFRQLELPKPDIQLHAGSGSHAEQTGAIMIGFEKVCKRLDPDLVLVHGDTNTTLAGALTAKKLCIPVAHVEAGLRSFDDSMPEEINRKVVDRISDYLYTPTQGGKTNLLHEGVKPTSIVVTGNTVIDAVKQNIALADKLKMVLPKGEYIFLTAHRPSNVDLPQRLRSLVNLADKLASILHATIIWPVHPRTQVMLKRSRIVLSPRFKVLESIGYLETLRYLEHARLVLTDSGGIQEEAYSLRRPILTLRENTERPETLTANKLIGLDLRLAKEGVQFFEGGEARWTHALGKGDAGVRIVADLRARLRGLK